MRLAGPPPTRATRRRRKKKGELNLSLFVSLFCSPLSRRPDGKMRHEHFSLVKVEADCQTYRIDRHFGISARIEGVPTDANVFSR